MKWLLCCLWWIPLSSAELLLYYTSQCPYSRQVLDFLKAHHKQVPLQNAAGNKKKLEAIGGKAVVPCLIIDGVALYDSGAIIDWLSKHLDELEDCH